LLPELPRLAHAALARAARDEPGAATRTLLARLSDEQRRTRRWIALLGAALAAVLALEAARFLGW